MHLLSRSCDTSPECETWMVDQYTDLAKGLISSYMKVGKKTQSIELKLVVHVDLDRRSFDICLGMLAPSE